MMDYAWQNNHQDPEGTAVIGGSSNQSLNGKTFKAGNQRLDENASANRIQNVDEKACERAKQDEIIADKTETDALPATQGVLPFLESHSSKEIEDDRPEEPPKSFFVRATKLLQSKQFPGYSLFGYHSQNRKDLLGTDLEVSSVSSMRQGRQRTRQSGTITDSQVDHSRADMAAQQPSSSWLPSATLLRWMGGSGANLQGNRPINRSEDDLPMSISRPICQKNISTISATVRTPEHDAMKLSLLDVNSPSLVDSKSSPSLSNAFGSGKLDSSTPSTNATTSSKSHVSSNSNLDSPLSSSVPGPVKGESSREIKTEGKQTDIESLIDINTRRTSHEILSYLRERIIQCSNLNVECDFTQSVSRAYADDISYPSAAFANSLQLLIYLHTVLNFCSLDFVTIFKNAVPRCVSLSSSAEDVIDGYNVRGPVRVFMCYSKYISAKLDFLAGTKSCLDGNFTIFRYLRKVAVEGAETSRREANEKVMSRLLEPETIETMIALLGLVSDLLLAICSDNGSSVKITSVTDAGTRRKGSHPNPPVHVDHGEKLETSKSKNSTIDVNVYTELNEVISFLVVADAISCYEAIRYLTCIGKNQAAGNATRPQAAIASVLNSARILATKDSLLGEVLFDDQGTGRVHLKLCSLLQPEDTLTACCLFGNEHVQEVAELDWNTACEIQKPLSCSSLAHCEFSNFMALHRAVGNEIESIENARRISGPLQTSSGSG